MALQPLILPVHPHPPTGRKLGEGPGDRFASKKYSMVSDMISFIDLLFETEAADFTSTGNLVEDIHSITTVHPLLEQALRNMLLQAGTDWGMVEHLLACRKLRCIAYHSENYYIHYGYDSNKIE